MMRKVILLSLLLCFTGHSSGKLHSPPEKPTLTRCRSPEKETFTCWWTPGSDGGLPTTYALYYRKESSTVYECPDYHTAGENSCFFNKNDTSVWINYNITVVATNALGKAFSDPVEIDVVYIVQPNTPEKVTAIVMEDKGWPFLRVSWEPPHQADTRSGWITLIYEIRVKLEEEDDWEMHLAGQQKMFNIFSLRSGGKYLVEVRCKPDHGFWSEWSSTTYIKVPDYFHREKSTWILITAFSIFTFLILMWLLHMNRHNLKHCILPPVPGPKIKGFDKQLLKNGKSNEILNALMVPDFPLTASSNYEDLLVEYLEVYIPRELELVLEESKDLHDGGIKSESSTSDCDSGRGSCDSRTLLMEKCGEAKKGETATDRECGPMRTEPQGPLKDWEEEALNYAHGDMVSREMPSGRVKTWPSVFSPLPLYSSSPLDQQSSLQMAKQHSLSASSYLTQPGHSVKEALGQSYWDICLSSKQPHLLNPPTPVCRELQANTDANIYSVGLKRAPAALRTTEYVEVQRVNNEDMVLLQPVVPGCHQMPQGEVYSKVKGVDSDNILLLQREAAEEDRFPCVDQVTSDVTGNTVSPTQKPSGCSYTALPVWDETAPIGNGYVDTATMCTLHTY